MVIELNRSLASRAAVHAALADPHRLQIVDELAMSDRSPSALGASLDLGSNLLAHHLRVLEEAGLIERLASAGDARRRYLRLLPERLATIAEPVATLVACHILFVCTANSARSQMAAAAWNARHEVPASSAGTRPAEAVRQGAVRAAARAGLDLADARPRSVEEVTEDPDLVVTVCDVAHEELSDLRPETRVLHWSIPDPSAAPSPSAFDIALRRIVARIESLAPHVRAA
jgi:protein-tyrosine-phosphatase